MIKNIIFYCFFFFFVKSVTAQTGGYIGKIHHFSVGLNWHPLTNIKLLNNLLDEFYSTSNSSLKKNNSITFRPGYELVLGKSFTIGIDAGYLFYSRGEVQVGPAELSSQGSVLFNNSNTNSSSNLTPVYANPKFYVSGFDFKLKLNIYKYKSSGLIAPLGSHLSFVFGAPFYSTSFSKTAVFKYKNLGIGMEFGKRRIIAGFVTIDYGFNFMIPVLGSTDFKGDLSEEIYYSSLASSLEAQLDYLQMHSVSIYLKFGYLL